MDSEVELAQGEPDFRDRAFLRNEELGPKPDEESVEGSPDVNHCKSWIGVSAGPQVPRP